MLVGFKAEGFRNLRSLDIDLEGGVNLILGNNGAGKTNFLEAVYLLATTKSFRTARIRECCCHGSSSFALSGEVVSTQRVKLELGWRLGERFRFVNGNLSSLSEHIGTLPVVCWSDAESRVLVGPPSARRRFMDRGVLGIRPSAIEVFSRYRAALDQKRRLLQDHGNEIEIWNRVVADAAWDLIRLRLEYVQILSREVDSIIDNFDLGLGNIDIEYISSPQAGPEGLDAIASEIESVSNREKTFQRPLVGPHRDDLRINWDGYDLRSVASAGERKVLALVLLAAHGRVIASVDRDVLYLIDDADTELDMDRLAAVWRVFASAKQLLLTSNRRRVWEDLDIDHYWRCREGLLESL